MAGIQEGPKIHQELDQEGSPWIPWIHNVENYICCYLKTIKRFLIVFSEMLSGIKCSDFQIDFMIVCIALKRV